MEIRHRFNVKVSVEILFESHVVNFRAVIYLNLNQDQHANIIDHLTSFLIK